MNKTKRGITLIETLIYLGVLSIFMACFMPWFFDLYIWKITIENDTKTVSLYLFIEGILADLTRNSVEISRNNLGDNFSFVNFEMNRLDNFKVYSFFIDLNDMKVGSTTYPLN